MSQQHPEPSVIHQGDQEPDRATRWILPDLDVLAYGQSPGDTSPGWRWIHPDRGAGRPRRWEDLGPECFPLTPFLVPAPPVPRDPSKPFDYAFQSRLAETRARRAFDETAEQRRAALAEVSAREVLASCDHTRFGTVTRRTSFLWISCCSGCETVLGPAPRPQDLVGDASTAAIVDLYAVADYQARRVEAQSGLRAWNEEAEDYLAQENPPLPPARHLPEPDRTIFRLGSLLSPAGGRPAFLTGEELRDLAIDRVAGIAEVRGLRSNTPRTDAEVIVDAVLKVVLDAMNGGRR